MYFQKILKYYTRVMVTLKFWEFSNFSKKKIKINKVSFLTCSK